MTTSAGSPSFVLAYTGVCLIWFAVGILVGSAFRGWRIRRAIKSVDAAPDAVGEAVTKETPETAHEHRRSRHDIEQDGHR